MFKPFKRAAHAAGLSVLALISACGGGGGSSAPPTPPPPVANRAPTLTTSAISTNEDVTTSAQLAATDPESNPVSFALTTNPQHGTATLTAAGSLTYAPAANYSGADTFGVTVSDNSGGSSAGTINVTVTAVDDAPVLSTTALSVNEDAVLNSQLAGADIENDAFTFQLLPGAAHGNVTLAADGTLTYLPNADYAGADQLRVRLVETSSGLTAGDQVVNISVLPVNDPPAARDDTLRVAVIPGQPVALPALANDIDVDGDTLVPTVVAQPRGGLVTLNPATKQLTFEPENGYVGPIQFTYRVNDGTANSNVATVRAVIGDFENLIFLSDYTTPGVTEVHVFDGLEVRRASDPLAPGSTITYYNLSGDLTKLVYIVDGNDAIRVYVKPVDGSGAAVLRYTSALKSSSVVGYLGASLNNDGSFMTVWDTLSTTVKQWYVVDNTTGTLTRIASLMPDLVDVSLAIFHPFEPNLVMVQGQTAGNVPRDTTGAFTAYLGDAADMRTLTRIGRLYSPGEYGAGEGFYYGRDPRYIYHAEFLHAGNNYPTSLLVYDRVTHAESPVVRFVFAPDRGMNGSGWPSHDLSRMCFGFYEFTTRTIEGPARFYSMDFANPASATPVSPVLDDISQCTYASDNRTVIYRIYTPGKISQQAYAVDSQNPGAPRLLAPPGETNSEQGTWMIARSAMRGAIAYFDNDGNPAIQNQIGRYYSLPLDGNGSPFLFSNTYVFSDISSFFYDSNSNGSFLFYARPQGSKAALELMSTHGLNWSIPLARAGETVGVRRASWLQRWP